jgi:hypothetical protein
LAERSAATADCSAASIALVLLPRPPRPSHQPLRPAAW